MADDGANYVDPWQEAEVRQKEKQNMFCRWKLFDMDEDGFMKTDIGILLFSQVKLNDNTTPPTLNHYYELYDDTKRATIETIVSHIRYIVPPPSQVSFGVTFLTAYLGECKNFQEFVVFRCADAQQSKVSFIEPSGRVYQNWHDFVHSNKLPSCAYMAPDNGVYKPDGRIIKFTSPEANKGIIHRHVDKVITAATFGVIGAGVFSVAPVSAAVTGVAIGVYGVGQSLSNLYDRFTHSESIRPDNVEAISNHLTIATAGLTGLSSVAMAFRQQIVKQLGKWGPLTLRTMNISVLCLDSAGLLFNSYIFADRLRAGEITVMDTFNLVLQVYLLHGQVSNTIEVHRMLSSSNATAMPQRLTKTQKRNLRKRRAKAAKRGVPMSSSTVKVTKTDVSSFDSMKLIAHCLGQKPVDFLRNHFSHDQIVTEFLNDVKQLVSSLWKRLIDSHDFFLNLNIHISNLAQILISEFEGLRRYSNYFNHIFGSNFTFDMNMVGLAFNGFQRVNDQEDGISEELERMVEQIPGERGEGDPTADDSIASDGNSSTTDCIVREIDVEIILDVVKRLLSKCIVHENSAKLLVFAEGVKYIQHVLDTELVEKYDLLFEVDTVLLGDSKMVAEALKSFVVKIDDNYFPSYEMLEEKLSEAVEKVAAFVETAECVIGIRDEGDVVASTNQSEVWAQISNTIANLYALVVSTESSTGLRQSLNILSRVADFYVGEKVAQFDELRRRADRLFRANADIVGPARAHQILANVGTSVEADEIAIKCVNTELDDAQICRLLERCCSEATCAKRQNCEASNDDADDEGVELADRVMTDVAEEDSTEDDDFVATLTMRTCSVFMQKIGPFDGSVDDPNKLLKKVLQFVAYRFACDTAALKNTCTQLQCNLDILGRAKYYKRFLQKLKAYPQKNKATLRRTSQLLMAFDDDVAYEYFVFCNSNNFEREMENVSLWQSSADEEGLQVKTTNCCSTDLSASEYGDIVTSLFHKVIDTNYSVESSKNSIVLKCDKYIVTFSLCEEDGSWLVILADQRVNQNND